MVRIAKKSRSVKGVKGQNKPKSPPRYTIRKDSLDRRYAIDKRTGRRVSVLVADAERAKRKKTAQKTKPSQRTTKKDLDQRYEIIDKRTGKRVKADKIFRGITPSKPTKAKKQRKTTKSRSGPSTTLKRREAAKKGWETRRNKKYLQSYLEKVSKVPIKPIIQEPEVEWRPPTFEELIGPLIPERVRMESLEEGIAERAAKYPKVAEVAMLAFLRLTAEINDRRYAIMMGQPTSPIATPRFDRLYGAGHGEFVRTNYFAQAKNLVEVDAQVMTLVEDEDYDYGIRELYTLYFSPDVM